MLIKIILHSMNFGNTLLFSFAPGVRASECYPNQNSVRPFSPCKSSRFGKIL